MRSNAVKQYTVMSGQSNVNRNIIDSDLFYDDPGASIEFSSGDGLFKKKKAAPKKKKTPFLRQGILKNFLSGAQKNRELKLKGKNEEAKAQQIAAQSLGKDDGTAQLLALQASKGGAKKGGSKDNTMMYAGIGIVGGILLIGGGIYLYSRSKKGK